MKKWFKNNIVLLALMLVGVIAAAVIIVGRCVAETEGRSYDIVLDYADLEKMADQSDEDIDYWLSFFHDAGITKVALHEINARKLADRMDGKVYLSSTSDLMSRYGWETALPDQVAEWVLSTGDKRDALIIFNDSDLYRFVKEGFETRKSEDLVMNSLLEDGTGYIWLHGEGKADGMTWATMPIGLEDAVADNIVSHGFALIPRTVVVKNTNSKAFGDAVMAEFKKYESPYLLDGGLSILGFEDNPEAVDSLIRYLEETGGTYCLIERTLQSKNLEVKGMEELVPKSGYNAVRAFTMWTYIQNSFAKYNYSGPEEIVNALYHAVAERNCRIVYLKMILEPESETDYITDPVHYDTLIGGLNSHMSSLGYTYGTVKPIEPYEPSIFLRILVGIGAVAAAVLLLSVLFTIPFGWKIALCAAGSVAVAAAFFIAPNTSKLVLSNGAGIAYPSLAAVLLCRFFSEKGADLKEKVWPTILRGVLASLVAMGLCFIGALSSAAALSETGFLLEMDIYRGVKFMQLVPLALFVIAYLIIFYWEKKYGKVCGENRDIRREERKSVRAKLGDTMTRTVSIRDVVVTIGIVLLLAILGGVGVYYIQRTGNTQNVSTFELIFRNFLEKVLVVRPRTKELLFGWPCVLLFVWSVRRRLPVLPFVFGACAVVGAFVSVVNTFLHIRTPIVLSMVRITSGYAIGLAIGVVFVLVADLIYRQITKRRARKING